MKEIVHLISNKIFFTTLISVIVIGAFSCISIEKDFPEKKTYLIELDSPKQSTQTSKFKDDILKIRRVLISNKYDSKSFVYRKSESKYESDFYNEFFISPQNILGEEIQKYLDKVGIFKSVLDISSRTESYYYLEIEVMSLYGDFQDSNKTKAVLQLQFRIFDDRDSNYKLILKKSFDEFVPIDSSSPESLVGGWKIGLTNILIRFTQEINRLR
ncbi:hypothetical protein [Leptospira sp. GIMC2001]|uniref:hypothetical protein n=1 Tax=Leptospira sp. GIMC2001 TaxID=1513297 RepID=UPI00234A2B4E|nr:hypothetical protein [Leptospira sp. GIMC2001]WCL48244.1 hypothetical protein O4O04_13115 [Leptospira sp. GIMC2001]